MLVHSQHNLSEYVLRSAILHVLSYVTYNYELGMRIRIATYVHSSNRASVRNEHISARMRAEGGWGRNLLDCEDWTTLLETLLSCDICYIGIFFRIR